MTVLVTGAGGYIGQRLTHRLALDGVAVRAQVRSDMQWPDRVEQVVGDLVADPDFAERIGHDVEVAIHLAGANEISTALDPDHSVRQTVMAAERVAHSGARRVIYLSTVHVYGNALTDGATVDERTTPLPETAYSTARLTCEKVFIQSGTPTMTFRLTNGVGPPFHPDIPRWSLVANELCRQGATRGQLTLRTAGVQWRDFVALRDVDSALSALVRGASFRPGTYNFGSGESITIRQLAAVVQDSFESLGLARPTLVAPEPQGVPPDPYHVDISALSQLGIVTRTSLRQAIDETVRFCVTHRASFG
jgi:UDP-glucose 4-epimerase